MADIRFIPAGSGKRRWASARLAMLVGASILIAPSAAAAPQPAKKRAAAPLQRSPRGGPPSGNHVVSAGRQPDAAGPDAGRTVEKAQLFLEQSALGIVSAGLSEDIMHIGNEGRIETLKHSGRCFVEIYWRAPKLIWNGSTYLDSSEQAYAKFGWGSVSEIANPPGYGPYVQLFILAINQPLKLKFNSDELKLRATEAMKYLKRSCNSQPDLGF